jgi:uncharacterized membrane protein
MTHTSCTTVPRKQRILGVDVARGVALIGMMAAHVFPVFNSHGSPTAAAVVAYGRSAATFVLVAGVGLALISGGRTVVRGRTRTAVSAGLAVRAGLIGALGLCLGLLAPYNDVAGILPFYGLMFLLAIPLLSLRPRVLAGIAAAVIGLGSVLLVATADARLPGADFNGDPTPGALVRDPLGVLMQLCVIGEYPIIVFFGYLCAGLAIGRLNLRSRRVAWWLLGAGAALTLTAQVVSALVLYPLGGLAHLISQNEPGDGTVNLAQTLLWEPEPSSSWWYLAIPAPYSHTLIDLTHTLGSAMAVLGLALLFTHIPAPARLLRPLAAAGGMVLTLYSAHLLVLTIPDWQDHPVLFYLLMVTGALTFALLWKHWFGQGPLERIVTAAAGRTRRITANLLATRPS